MSETKKITCIRCGAKVETTGSGDFTTFVCEACQDKANLPAYKQEIKDLQEAQAEREKNKEERLPSYDKRIAFLDAKVKALEEEE